MDTHYEKNFDLIILDRMCNAWEVFSPYFSSPSILVNHKHNKRCVHHSYSFNMCKLDAPGHKTLLLYFEDPAQYKTK